MYLPLNGTVETCRRPRKMIMKVPSSSMLWRYRENYLFKYLATSVNGGDFQTKIRAQVMYLS